MSICNFNQDWANIICESINAENNSPSGIWGDFNYWYYNWTLLVNMKTQGLICVENLPAEPNPADYPDITTPSNFNKNNYYKIVDTGIPGDVEFERQDEELFGKPGYEVI